LFELAARHGGSLLLTQVASEVTMGGHFDKIVYTMDKMMKQLKVESKKDVAKKLRCEDKTVANTKQVDDIVFSVNTTKAKVARMVNETADWGTTIAKISTSMAATSATIAKMKQQAIEAHAQFEKATNDDLASIALLEKAAASLDKVYKQNAIKKTHLIEDYDDAKPKPNKQKQPTVDSDSYGGQKAKSTGVVAIIEMIVSDLKGEVKDGILEDKSAAKAFHEDLAAAELSLKEQKKARANAVVAKAALKIKAANLKDIQLAQMVTDQENVLKTQAALNVECAFLTNMVKDPAGTLKTQFQLNIDNRLTEAKGLSEAKTFLMGATVIKF